ncbi:MAG TPA: FAD-binding oxidoreductase [Ilumatobacteraceae bacterium]|nr:FAD-binding oxidoreductase [Ilumatobacteraceae bacterium]
MSSYDVLVIGGGIAGVSIGYELAADRSVGLLEMEATLAFHTTGRSVATFLESYGGRTIRLLTTASRAFMEDPPDGFARPLLKPLPLVWVAPHGDLEDMRLMHGAVTEFVPDMRILSGDEVVELTKVIRSDWVAGGLLERGASEIDVAALHGGYAARLRARGGDIHTSCGVTAMKRVDDLWYVTDRAGNSHVAPVVVNAAGSWCDIVADLAGARPVGIHPLRRTVFTIGAPTDVDPLSIPLVADVAGTFYFKPEGPQILCSPADEVPSAPCDARPDELDIAKAIDVINAATTLDIRHVRSSWAGLRNFVADRSPVAGFDDEVEGFFWFVGQGGYGIQISPALAQAGASLVRSGLLSDSLTARGLEPAALDRRRLADLTTLDGH